MRKTIGIIPLVAAALTFGACNRVPDHVIAPDEMADLMADLRMADAVVKLHPATYRADSGKYILREAVFRRHATTAAAFDTSLVWYGHNIGRYQEVTERSIEILEERQRSLAALASSEAAMSVSGDSVDVWSLPLSYAITRRSPSQYIAFSLPADQNSELGDTYTWRFKFITLPQNADWTLTAEYDDGTVETMHANLSSSEVMRREITFQTDTTLRLTHIGGWLHLQPDAHRPVLVDSLTLTRRRLNRDTYSRPYQQRRVSPPHKDAPQDTIA